MTEAISYQKLNGLPTPGRCIHQQENQAMSTKLNRGAVLASAALEHLARQS
jgi:hypothetical protein